MPLNPLDALLDVRGRRWLAASSALFAFALAAAAVAWHARGSGGGDVYSYPRTGTEVAAATMEIYVDAGGQLDAAALQAALPTMLQLNGQPIVGAYQPDGEQSTELPNTTEGMGDAVYSWYVPGGQSSKVVLAFYDLKDGDKLVLKPAAGVPLAARELTYRDPETVPVLESWERAPGDDKRPTYILHYDRTVTEATLPPLQLGVTADQWEPVGMYPLAYDVVDVDDQDVRIRLRRPIDPQKLAKDRDGDSFSISLLAMGASVESNRQQHFIGLDYIWYTKPKATLEARTLVDPDDNLRTRIDVRFASPLYDDSATIDRYGQQDTEAAAELARDNAKRVLRSLRIEPDVELDEDSVTVDPYMAVLRLPLEEGKEYSITLKGLKNANDETMPTATLQLPVPVRPYLGMRVAQRQVLYPAGAVPQLTLLQHRHDAAAVRICRIPLASLGAVEHYVAERSWLPASEQFFAEGIDALPSEQCWQKDLPLEQLKTTVKVTDVAPEAAAPGLYVAYLARDRDVSRVYTATDYTSSDPNAQRELRWQEPILYGVVGLHLVAKTAADNTVLLQVTDIATGEPVEGATVAAVEARGKIFNDRFEGVYRREPVAGAEKMLGTSQELGRTAAGGLLRTQPRAATSLRGTTDVYDEYKAVIYTAQTDDGRSGYVSSTWDDGIAGWNFGFGLDYSAMEPNAYTTKAAYLTAERTLYKPGETAVLKGIVRDVRYGRLAVPAGGRWTMVVRDAQGNEVLNKDVAPSDLGGVQAQLPLQVGWPTGGYNAELLYWEGNAPYSLGYAFFSVEDIQTPKYEVKVSLTSPDADDNGYLRKVRSTKDSDGKVTGGRADVQLQAAVRAGYYAGGPVAGQRVDYALLREPYYSYDASCFWGCGAASPSVVAEGTARLDAGGMAVLQLPISFSSVGSDYRYSLVATVIDAAGERVSGSGVQLLRLPAGLVLPDGALQVAPATPFIELGKPLEVQVTSPAELTKKAVSTYELAVVRRTWHSYAVPGRQGTQPRLEEETEEVHVLPLADVVGGYADTVPASFTLQLPADALAVAGDYRLQLRKHGEEHPVSTADVIVVDTAATTNTPVLADNKVAVVPDKAVYRVGETARVLVRLPFAPARVLLTTEQGTVLKAEQRTMERNAEIWELPITEDTKPNVYIGIVAYGPRAADDADAAHPVRYRVGYGELIVDQKDYKMQIDVQPSQATYRPGDTARLQLATRNATGQPVPAEMLVAVVDEAIIAMAGNIDMDVLAKMYRKAPFGISTALTAVGMDNYVYFARKGVAGGSGGKGGSDTVRVREILKHTLFVDAAVRTGADGRAELQFALPDNIGNFRVIALGAGAGNVFGSAESSFAVRQPLAIEPAFPSIIRVGDTAVWQTRLLNTTAAPMQVRVRWASDRLAANPTEQTVTVPAGGAATVPWQVQVRTDIAVPLDAPATYTVTAVADNAGDGLRGTVTVRDVPVVGQRMVRSVVFANNLALQMPLPAEETNVSRSSMGISVATTQLAALERALAGLKYYPYGCIEQTVSAMLPAALVLRLGQGLGLAVDAAQLEATLKTGWERAKALQMEDGGFAYWPGDTASNADYTAIALAGLLQVQATGATADDAMLAAATTYTEKQVQQLAAKSAAGKRIYQSEWETLARQLRALGLAESPEAANAAALLAPHLQTLPLQQQMEAALGLARLPERAPAVQQAYDATVEAAAALAAGVPAGSTIDGPTATALALELLQLDAREQYADARNQLLQQLARYDLAGYRVSTYAQQHAFAALWHEVQVQKAAVTDAIAVSYTVRVGEKQVKGLLTIQPGTLIARGTVDLAALQPLVDHMEVKLETEGVRLLVAEVQRLLVPADMLQAQPQQSGMTATRLLYRLEGNGRLQQLDADATLEVGQTYVSRIDVALSQPQNDLVVEDFLPSSVRVLQQDMQTNTAYRATRFATEITPTYTQTSPQAMMVHARSVPAGRHTVSYLFVPTVEGSVLYPPATAYGMYQAERYATTAAQRLHTVPSR